MVRDLGPLIGAIDQGTSSTRFLVFAANTSELITYHQVEIKKIFPNEGWVEQNPHEILATIIETIERVNHKLRDLGINPKDIKCIGISNQRESSIVWDRDTGEPLYNSIVWLDNRTKDLVEKCLDSIPGRDINWFKDRTGLPISTYFSAFKLRWLIDNVPDVRLALKEKRLMFGTVDSWIVYKLTGNHLTDSTNASRTFLMDIETCTWDKQLLKFFNIPEAILPKIQPSSDAYGEIKFGPMKGVPITGVIGDQSAALLGQNCFKLGQTKVTYGTGCFLMQNIGPGPVTSALRGVPKEAKQSLIVTVAYHLANKSPVYALEGSIAIAGAAITWLRDNVELIQSYGEVETLARSVYHTSGVFFIPAFQGLYAPYWDPNATGIVIGLSQFSTKAHIVRATLEAIAYQTVDILTLMRKDASFVMIDGGMSCNDLLCQTLADLTGYEIVRPSMVETTAMGAAMIAGDYLGLWDLKQHHPTTTNPEVHQPDSMPYTVNKENPGRTISNTSTDSITGLRRDSITPREMNGVQSLPPSTTTRRGISSQHASLVKQTSILEFISDHLHVARSRHFSASHKKAYPKGSEVFKPMISSQFRQDKINEWKMAVERCRRWTKVKKEEMKRIDYKRLATIPIGLHVLFSLGIMILSQYTR